jgi:type IV secretion system protein VirB4
MVRLRRLLKDHTDAGALNDRLALWGFVDETTFLTKAGAVGVVFRLDGVDDACLDHDERRTVVRRFEQALRQLDESCRLYSYLIKRPARLEGARAHADPVVREALARRVQYFATKADTLFDYELYVVVLYEGWRTGASLAAKAGGVFTSPAVTLRDLLSVRRVMTVLSTDLTRAVAQLHAKAEAFAAQLRDTVHPTRLSKAETFRFLRRLLNPTPDTADGVALRYDTHVDFFAADSTVECARDALVIDGYRVKVLVMKEPPSRTYAHVLEDLLAIPSRFVACLEWQRLPNERMRRELHTRRRHFFNKKVSIVNYVSPDTRPEEMLSDDSAAAIVTELGQALTELDVQGRVFGACSLSLVLLDRDARRLDQSVAAGLKAFATQDGAAFEETYNRLNAWLATIPGNSAHNVRRLALLNTNGADLAFLFAPSAGERESVHLGGACLAVCEAEHQALYHWNLHYGDVGHALVLGATGTGKSFLLNFLLTHAQAYDPTTVIFDLGGSYDNLTRRLGGNLWRLGLRDRTVSINPFSLPPTPESLHFLHGFVRVLLRAGGSYALTTRDDRDIGEAVESLYALDPSQRRLLTLAHTLPRPLAQQLHRWTAGGPYASVFDGAEDTLTWDRVQCFEFQGLEDYPLVLEPLLFYLLHRANASIRDHSGRSRLKLFLLDEAWRFAKDPTVKAYMVEALKTWRKHNAAMLLATQSDQDFVETDLLRAVLENCPTKVFLANPGIDLAHARDRFHLNAREARRIADLRPREQLLLKRPDISTVLSLHVDPESYAVYTNRPLHYATAEKEIA